MRILSLDTSTLVSTCSLIENDKVIGEYSLSRDMSHSEKLVPMIKSLLDELEIKIKDIDLFAVATGPGSFTGLRIGLATIKAFAHVLDKPVVGVSSLEALAYNLPYNKIVVPMMDARRNRVYTAIYKFEDELVNIMEAQAIDIDVFLDELDSYDEVLVNGDGSLVYKDKIKERLGKKVKFATAANNYSRASSVAELAKFKYEAGYVDDFYSLTPDYLRVSQAERQRKEMKK